MPGRQLVARFRWHRWLEASSFALTLAATGLALLHTPKLALPVAAMALVGLGLALVLICVRPVRIRPWIVLVASAIPLLIAVGDAAPSHFPLVAGALVAVFSLGGALALALRIRRDDELEPEVRRVFLAMLGVPVVGLLLVFVYYWYRDEPRVEDGFESSFEVVNEIDTWGPGGDLELFLDKPSWAERRAATLGRRRAYNRARATRAE